jgi:hypothetical protein
LQVEESQPNDDATEAHPESKILRIGERKHGSRDKSLLFPANLLATTATSTSLATKSNNNIGVQEENSSR